MIRAALWSFLLPAAATVAALRYVIPSRMDGGSDGPWAALATSFDRQPLLLAIGLFLLLAATCRYWQPHSAQRSAETPGRRRAERFKLLCLVLGLTAFMRVSVVEVVAVEGVSMAPTLNVGDRLVVEKTAYGLRIPFSKRRLGATPPRRGDLVVFPSGPRASTGGRGGPAALVKRVIGLPGDTISFIEGAPIVNGRALPSCDAGPFLTSDGETVIRGRLFVETIDGRPFLTVRTPLDDAGFTSRAYTVPPGELFVLGDDRGASADSRTWVQRSEPGIRIDELRGRVTRLAMGRFRDGRFDPSRLLSRLRIEVRAPALELRELDARVAACLRSLPAR